MRTSRQGIWTALAIASLSLGVGCADREHMSDDYARRNKMFFAKQRVSKTPAQGTPTGLDSEESAVIHGTYREGLGKSTPASQGSSARVLMLEPNKVDTKK